MDRAEFEAHPIWAVLDKMETDIRQSEAVAGPASAEYVSRYRALISYARSHRGAGHEFFHRGMLDNVNSLLTNAVNMLSNWSSNPAHAPHLAQSLEFVEQALPAIGQWPTPPARGGAARQAKEMYESYRESTDEAIRDLLRKVADLNTPAGDVDLG